MTSDPIDRFFMERSARLNRRARLRTMTSNEIVDTSIRVYQQLGWTFLKLTVIPALFVVAAIAFVTQYVLPSLLVTQNANSLTTQFSEVGVAGALAVFVGGPLFVLGVSATTAIVIQLVSDYMLGNVPSPEAALRAAKRSLITLFRVHFWELLVSCGVIVLSLGLSILSSILDKVVTNESMLAGLVALVAFVGFALGGVVFLVAVSQHALSAPIAVLEGSKPRATSRRSAKLMKGQGPLPSGYGNVWSLYGVLFFVSLITYLGLGQVLSQLGYPDRFASYLDNLPFSGVLIEALRLIPTFLWVWSIVPIWSATITIIYYERRIRLEGYDIEALAADVWRTDRQNRFEL